MKSILLMAFLVIGFQAVADDSIHSIVRGHQGEPHLVKFNSGAVKFIEAGEEHLLAPYEAKLQFTKANSRIENKLLSLQTDEEYVPTPVADKDLQSIWNRMNPYIKRKSECSDRAHVWSFDEFQKTGTKSQKAFLLLTNGYIIRNRFKWWFHVAPMYTTTSGQKIVMDYQFLDHPVTFEEWKNRLVFTKRACVTDFRFLDYDAGADQSQDCYTKQVPMYFYIPGDIGNLESGRGKTGWSNAEVNGARSRAFFKGSI
jgi:hypothetical protein